MLQVSLSVLLLRDHLNGRILLEHIYNIRHRSRCCQIIDNTRSVLVSLEIEKYLNEL